MIKNLAVETFYAPASVDRGHIVFSGSGCPFVRKKDLTLAIALGWLVIEFSYFTYVFLGVRPFLDSKAKVICQGQVDVTT